MSEGKRFGAICGVVVAALHVEVSVTKPWVLLHSLVGSPGLPESHCSSFPSWASALPSRPTPIMLRYAGVAVRRMGG